MTLHVVYVAHTELRCDDVWLRVACVIWCAIVSWNGWTCHAYDEKITSSTINMFHLVSWKWRVLTGRCGEELSFHKNVYVNCEIKSLDNLVKFVLQWCNLCHCKLFYFVYGDEATCLYEIAIVWKTGVSWGWGSRPWEAILWYGIYTDY